jgi:hypothetical protein
MINIHLHIIGSKSFFDLLDELDFNYSVSFDKNIKYNNKDPLIRVVFFLKIKNKKKKKKF